MGFVISLIGYRPAARYDDQAWTNAEIQEGAASSGPWSVIDDQPLTPPDADPTHPASRNFTTSNASAESGLWYRIAFKDAADGVQHTRAAFMDTAEVVPSAADIREWSNAEWDEWGYPDDATPDRLEELIQRAVPELEALLQKKLSTIALDDPNIPLVQKAIQHLVEYAAGSDQMETLETAADYDMIQSFTAAGYSETRRSGAGAFSRFVLHPWPLLNRILELLVGAFNPGFLNDIPRVGQQSNDWNVADYVINFRHREFGLFDLNLFNAGTPALMYSTGGGPP